MNTRGPVMGAAVGLLLAAVLIAGVSLAAGGGSLHVDLIKANGATAQDNGLSAPSGQTGGTTTVAPQTGVQTTEAISVSAGATPISSLDSVASQSGASIGLLLLPIVLGAVLGAVFYGTYARRVDTD